MPLLIVFILVPIIEIALLIKVGSFIGWFPTVLIVLGTAFLGAWLLKQQGRVTLARYRQSLAEGRIPAQEMIEGLALVFGGALLLTPGFFTDFIGFLCLLPGTRQRVVRQILQRVTLTSFSSGGAAHYQQSASGRATDYSQPGTGRTIDADYEVKEK